MQTDTTELFGTLDKTTEALLNLLGSFNEKEINTVPFQGSWTAAQLAVHVTKSNHGMARSLKMEGKLTDHNVEAGVKKLDETFLDFDKKFQSPAFIVPGDGPFSKETVIADLKASIDELKEIRQTINLSETIAHPVFGEITKFEILYFVIVHSKRHIRQLENIAKAIKK